MFPQAKSLALTVSDPDAPNGTWSHWIIYNITAQFREVPENTDPGTEGISDFGKNAYGGPCPPDQKLHHYIFRAYALDAVLTINEDPTMANVEYDLRKHILARAKLTGTYQKSAF